MVQAHQMTATSLLHRHITLDMEGEMQQPHPQPVMNLLEGLSRGKAVVVGACLCREKGTKITTLFMLTIHEPASLNYLSDKSYC